GPTPRAKPIVSSRSLPTMWPTATACNVSKKRGRRRPPSSVNPDRGARCRDQFPVIWRPTASPATTLCDSLTPLNHNEFRRAAMDGWASHLNILLPQSDFSRRGFVMTSLAAGFALAVQPVMAQTVITTDTSGLEAGEVQIPVADGAIPAYRAM